jgi:hypothetical protein
VPAREVHEQAADGRPYSGRRVGHDRQQRESQSALLRGKDESRGGERQRRQHGGADRLQDPEADQRVNRRG